jgi:hypothetical protein
MERLSRLIPIFALPTGNSRRHRGELISFDPPENLQNSMYKGEKLEKRSSYSLYIQPCRNGHGSIYSIGVGQLSFLLIRVLQNLLAKDAKKVHTLCLPMSEM